MKSQNTRRFGALNTGTFSYIANGTSLDAVGKFKSLLKEGILTSFHLCFDMLSTPEIGSMNTSFTTRVSGTQIAQRR